MQFFLYSDFHIYFYYQVSNFYFFSSYMQRTNSSNYFFPPLDGDTLRERARLEQVNATLHLAASAG